MPAIAPTVIPESRPEQSRARILLAILLVLAVVVRLYHFPAPLVDSLYTKQVFIANKARNMARQPTSPLRGSLDFLDDQGQKMTLIEEVPLYTGILAAGYRLFGEHEWLGRLLSIAGTLVAVVALRDLFRREFDEQTGLIAAFLLATSPLLIFYGRAVLPDPWMLACMILCACAYRRHLDEVDNLRWLAAAAVAGLFAALFKYYGLMILIPLAEMAHRRGGWRAWFRPRFLGLATCMILPIGVWIVTVFTRYPNPTSGNAYFSFQQPWTLLHPRLYDRLFLGFLVKDCGPVAAVLVAIGVHAVIFRGRAARPLLGWTLMGLCFFFLFAPKLFDHDYYELMMLPAAAGWGAIGWRSISRLMRTRPRRRLAFRAALVALAAVIHSPLVMHGKFELELDHMVVAARIKELCPPSGRIVVLGQRIGWPVVHYSGRQGWVEQGATLEAGWRDDFKRYHSLGAQFVALYFDPLVTASQRESFRPLLASLPLVEMDRGLWFRQGRPCEYYIFRLEDPAPPRLDRTIATRDREPAIH